MPHTQGPWLYRGKSDSVHEGCETHPFGPQIFRFVEDAAPSDADLALILAAPELLAGLRAAAAQLRLYEQYHRAKGTPESVEKADVNAKLAYNFELTIARATGEGPCPRTGELYHRWMDGFCHKCGAKHP